MSSTNYVYSQLQEEYKNITNTDKQLNEVLKELDEIQHSPEEIKALEDMVNYHKNMKDTDEWDINSNKAVSSLDCETIDHQEMIGDMYTFEDENKTHELFATNPWESRSPSKKVSKRSETTLLVEITKKGDNYYTGVSEYGKVYIPKSFGCEGENYVKVRAKFQGFEGCRKTSLPWRAVNKL